MTTYKLGTIYEDNESDESENGKINKNKNKNKNKIKIKNKNKKIHTKENKKVNNEKIKINNKNNYNNNNNKNNYNNNQMEIDHTDHLLSWIPSELSEEWVSEPENSLKQSSVDITNALGISTAYSTTNFKPKSNSNKNLNNNQDSNSNQNSNPDSIEISNLNKDSNGDSIHFSDTTKVNSKYHKNLNLPLKNATNFNNNTNKNNNFGKSINNNPIKSENNPPNWAKLNTEDIFNAPLSIEKIFEKPQSTKKRKPLLTATLHNTQKLNNNTNNNNTKNSTVFPQNNKINHLKEFAQNLNGNASPIYSLKLTTNQLSTAEKENNGNPVYSTPSFSATQRRSNPNGTLRSFSTSDLNTDIQSSVNTAPDNPHSTSDSEIISPTNSLPDKLSNQNVYTNNNTQSFSTSPLKLFQKHDTYTNSRLGSLLPELADGISISSSSNSSSARLTQSSSPRTQSLTSFNNDSTTTAPSSNNDPASAPLNDKNIISNSKNIVNTQKSGGDSKTVTTQDFLYHAEEVMDMIRGLKKPGQDYESYTTEAGQSFDSYISNDDKSLSSIENQNLIDNSKHSFQLNNSSSSDTSSSQSSVLSTLTKSEVDKNKIINSTQNKIENGKGKGKEPLNFGKNEEQTRLSSNQTTENHHGPKLITNTQIGGIMSPFKGMVYDKENHRWIKLSSNGKSSNSASAQNTSDESDPFAEIDDFEDSQEMNSHSHSFSNSQKTMIDNQNVQSNQLNNSFVSPSLSIKSTKSLKSSISSNSKSTSKTNISSILLAASKQDTPDNKQYPMFNLNASLDSIHQSFTPDKVKSENPILVAKKNSYQNQSINCQPSKLDTCTPNRSQLPIDTSTITKRGVSFTFDSLQHSAYGNDVSYLCSLHDVDVTRASQINSSFSSAIQQLVSALTDIEPFEPYWEDIETINLKNKAIETLIKLDYFCPKLVELNIDNNKLGYLTGIPNTVRSLSVSENNLWDMTSFSFLHNLQYLDISNNKLETLVGLKDLVHLRDLNVDGNKIVNLNGILYLDGLIRLSATNNQINQLDFSFSKLQKLEFLNVSSNYIPTINGLEKLPSLALLDASNNSIESISFPEDCVTKSLRILKLSKNKFRSFSCRNFPNLRVLNVDHNYIQTIEDLKFVKKLEWLSTREQLNSGSINFPGAPDIKKLSISLNIINSFKLHQFSNLQSLELVSCHLSSLPSYFSKCFSDLRVLHLSFNGLTDISPCAGLKKLRKFFLSGNLLDSLDNIMITLSTLNNLQALDLRVNPLTYGFYFPHFSAKENDSEYEIFEKCMSGFSRGERDKWVTKNDEYQSNLPQEIQNKIQLYIALMCKSCTSLCWLDGIHLDKESVQFYLSVLPQAIENLSK